MLPLHCKTAASRRKTATPELLATPPSLLSELAITAPAAFYAVMMHLPSHDVARVACASPALADALLTGRGSAGLRHASVTHTLLLPTPVHTPKRYMGDAAKSTPQGYQLSDDPACKQLHLHGLMTLPTIAIYVDAFRATKVHPNPHLHPNPHPYTLKNPSRLSHICMCTCTYTHVHICKCTHTHTHTHTHIHRRPQEPLPGCHTATRPQTAVAKQAVGPAAN